MKPTLPPLYVPPAASTHEEPFAGSSKIWQTPRRLHLEFVRRQAATNPGVTYTVETGADLTNLLPLDLSSAQVVPIDATWERVSVTDPALTARRFGRVRLSLWN